MAYACMQYHVHSSWHDIATPDAHSKETAMHASLGLIDCQKSSSHPAELKADIAGQQLLR